MANPDPYQIAGRFNHFLRVTDVSDGLDAVGRNNVCLMDPKVRPLWMGMRFWGPAVTMQVVPANRLAPAPLRREDALRQHAIWGEMNGFRANLNPEIKKGCVVVTSTGGARECGWWGSMNSLAVQAAGAVGIVTDGNCRDTDEVILQKTPVACAGIGRPIIPGRTELESIQTPVSCGGVFVRPGDIIGCDWDGVVVVPIEAAEDVLYFAARIAVDDKKARLGLYKKLGMERDETVDWEAAAEYFKDIL